MKHLILSVVLASLLLGACKSSGGSGASFGLAAYAQVSGDAVVATDGSQAVAVGSGYGEAGLRGKGTQFKFMVFPFLVETGQVYLLDSEAGEVTIPTTSPIPLWAAALLGDEVVARYGLIVE